MKFEDEGYIINIKKHGESSAILSVLTRKNGKVVGFVKNALSKKNLSTFQLGNKVKIEAYARVDENMLSLKVELISPDTVNFLNNSQKLETLASLCSLSNICMPEQMPIDMLYQYLEKFFIDINQENWLSNYAYFEFYLLDFLGISLDLSECSATGTTKNLYYVSPKTGKAVCKEAGAPYQNRLFLYPHFIVNKNFFPSAEELKNLLKMTEFFLNKNFFQTHSLKFPPSRANLLSNLGL